jgi:hypothetical protein
MQNSIFAIAFLPKKIISMNWALHLALFLSTSSLNLLCAPLHYATICYTRYAADVSPCLRKGCLLPATAYLLIMSFSLAAFVRSFVRNELKWVARERACQYFFLYFPVFGKAYLRVRGCCDFVTWLVNGKWTASECLYTKRKICLQYLLSTIPSYNDMVTTPIWGGHLRHREY